MLEEDGRVEEELYKEYMELGLSNPPKITHASSEEEALRLIDELPFDLVISMLDLGTGSGAIALAVAAAASCADEASFDVKSCGASNSLIFHIFLLLEKVDYYLFLFVALIPWMFCATSIVGGSTCILANQNLVTKIYFPREVLPLSVVTSNFINMLYCFVIVLSVVVIFSDKTNFAAWLYLPLITILEYVLVLGFTFCFSALTVYFRDLEHILGILTMGWQFLTPVMYSVDMVPKEYITFFNLNPMTPIIVAYRDVLYYGKTPHLDTLCDAFIFSILILILGFTVFNRLKRRFAEEL